MMASMVSASLSTGCVIGQQPSERNRYFFPSAAGAGKVHLRDRDALALDVHPDVALAPVQQRLDAHVLAGGATRGELVPELRRLVLVIPFEILRARAEIALLGPGGVFIAANAGDERVPLVLRHDLLQRHGLELVRHGHGVGGVVADGPARRVIAAAGARVLIDFHDQIELVVLHRPIAVVEHLREIHTSCRCAATDTGYARRTPSSRARSGHSSPCPCSRACRCF